MLELETERLDLTRQLGDRVAELADSQRIAREAEIKEKSLNEKIERFVTGEEIGIDCSLKLTVACPTVA